MMFELIVPEPYEWQWLVYRVMEAGSLDSLRRTDQLNSAPEYPMRTLARAFGKLIALARLAKGWNVERLSDQAAIDSKSLCAIEAGDASRIDPRAVVYLATVLKLPLQILLELAGFAEPSSPALRDTACRLAAQPMRIKPRDAQAALLNILNAHDALNRGGGFCAGRPKTKCPHHKENP
jgi:transcriptional regulator with XRE-family HTH domain